MRDDCGGGMGDIGVCKAEADRDGVNASGGVRLATTAGLDCERAGFAS